ncbi:MAG: efflux transporter outer membrane subunit [Acidiferrobacter sp.]
MRRAFVLGPYGGGGRPWYRLLPVLLVPWALSACAMVGPRFVAPQVVVPSHFVAAPQDAPPAWPRRSWWKGFGSPALDRLITEAEVHNFSIRIAIAELQAANAQVEVAGAPLLPSISGAGSADTQRVGGNTGGGSGSNNLFSGNGRAVNAQQFAASLQVSYELDFWGKNRDALRAAEADAAASRFNRDTVALTAVSAVATTWFQVLADRDELAIARKNLVATQSLLAQLQAELQAGTTDAVAVAQQAALVAAERATIPSLESQLRQEVIGLGILVGKPPELLTVPVGTLNTLHIPPLMPGVPSALLTRRPDIAQAQANLIAANANVRAAIANFFPSISLTGSAGWQSTALSALIAPGSLLLNAAASLSQPIFEGGALMGDLAVSRAVYREDIVVYEQAVVQAFSNVETALTALHFATEQEHEEQIAIDRAQDAVAAVTAQLAAGIVDVGSVITAQQTLLNDENTYEQARLTRFLAAVNLYEALGGGWHARAATPPRETIIHAE